MDGAGNFGIRKDDARNALEDEQTKHKTANNADADQSLFDDGEEEDLDSTNDTDTDTEASDGTAS